MLVVREWVGKAAAAGEGDARNFLVGWDVGRVDSGADAEGARTIRKPPTSSVPFTRRD